MRLYCRFKLVMRFAFQIIGLFIFCCSLQSFGQEGMVVRGRILDSDTLLISYLPVQQVTARRTWKSRRAKQKYVRLSKKVRKVYPYARLAGHRMEQYAASYEKLDSRSAKRKFYKEIEEELKREYGAELKKLTISEGAILIKLIDRQTGDSSYELVKELRGKFSAFFWQGLACIFGQNLKNEYDPNGDDREIEFIVRQIEQEQLASGLVQ